MTIRLAAHGEAMDEALRESVATKLDIALAARDMTIRMGAIAIALFAALASIKFCVTGISAPMLRMRRSSGLQFLR